MRPKFAYNALHIETVILSTLKRMVYISVLQPAVSVPTEVHEDISWGKRKHITRYANWGEKTRDKQKPRGF
jgi:hypothetical protein